MADLVRLGRKILKEKYPDLEKRFYEPDYLLGKVVFAYRIRKNLTQLQLANEAEIDVRLIYRIEGGSTGVDEDVYHAVIEALGLDWEEVLEYVENNKGVE